jgi:hypothetical protein
MDACDDFIRRIVSRSGILTSGTRRDLERELHAHLEDALEEARSGGCDETGILRIVCDRFRDPDEIAQEFAVAHRLERRVISLAYSVALMGISVLTVAGLILALQLAVAIFLGTSPSNAFPHLREEIIGFGSLALGYIGALPGGATVSKTVLDKSRCNEQHSLYIFVHVDLHWSTFDHSDSRAGVRIRSCSSDASTDRYPVGLVLGYCGTGCGSVPLHRITRK